MNTEDIIKLENIANDLRKNTLKMVYEAKSGHIGGSFSIAEIIACLYFNYLNIEVSENGKNLKDIVILSKGHASPILYSALFKKGIIASTKQFRNVESDLEGHASNHIPSIPVSTGSLGQGLSIAIGIANAKKLDEKDDKVVCIVGDGEIEEGQIWEAFLSASKYSLDNLTIVIDANNIQLDGRVEDIKNIYPLKEKLDGFNFEIIEIDGHNILEILEALNSKQTKTKVIIANTIKGKGVSFMENTNKWHGKAPNDEEYDMAMKELNG